MEIICWHCEIFCILFFELLLHQIGMMIVRFVHAPVVFSLRLVLQRDNLSIMLSICLNEFGILSIDRGLLVRLNRSMKHVVLLFKLGNLSCEVALLSSLSHKP